MSRAKTRWLLVGLLCLVLWPQAGLASQDQAQVNPAKEAAKERQAPTAEPDPSSSEPLPSVDEVLDRYVQAIGGRAAWEEFSTRSVRGTVEIMGVSGTYESHWKAPNKSLMKMEFPDVGVLQQGFDGVVGWRSHPATGIVELSGNELAQLELDAEFYSELKLRSLYPQMEVLGKAKVHDRDAYVVLAAPREGSPRRMYFDTETWLQVRVDVEQPQGKETLENYLEDYREVDGILMPFTMRQVTSEGTVVFRTSTVQHNVPIDDAKFSKPTAPAVGALWGKHMEAAARAHEQGNHAEAQEQLNLALKEAEKFGPNDGRLALTLGLLGRTYRDQGWYLRAEPLLKRALAIFEKALGPEHPDVATSLNHLALLYKQQGKYAQAEPLYRRALAIFEKALGPEHPDVATSLNNLAKLYHAQGKYAQAEPLCQRALAIKEKALGPDHPDVALGLNDLAGTYFAQGKYAQAETLFQRALAISEKALGPEHDMVALTLDNLAVLYIAQDKYAQAEPISARAVAIYEKTLGPNHPELARALQNRAALMRKMNRDAEAKKLEARAQAIRAKHAQENPPD
jgi:tetratricopeptide (TPR) repeat protein